MFKPHFYFFISVNRFRKAKLSEIKGLEDLPSDYLMKFKVVKRRAFLMKRIIFLGDTHSFNRLGLNEGSIPKNGLSTHVI